MGAMLDQILLDKEQIELLVQLVEAARNVPREQRQKFFVLQAMGTPDEIHHPGFPNGHIEAYVGDAEQLIAKRLLSGVYAPSGELGFDVTPEGFRYYEELKSQGPPTEQVEATVREYLESAAFHGRHAGAFEKWADAEGKLWGSDSEKELTTIGHLCREAMQLFATSLVEQYKPAEVDQDPAHAVGRVRAVIEARKAVLGQTERKWLDALLPYWGAVSDLIQRQEHGAQREGGTLTWEDARRVVFQTANVMFEVDGALSRATRR
jgi:hypothetical protein